MDARKADVGATDVVSVTDGNAEALRDGVLSENRDAMQEGCVKAGCQLAADVRLSAKLGPA